MMKFKTLASYLEKLEKTSSRNEITVILAELLGKLSAEEVDKVVYLLLGRLAANYEGIVFNLAERMMVRVVSQATAKDVKVVRDLYKKEGDLGTAAEKLLPQNEGKLTVGEVYDRLREIAQLEGVGSQEKKIDFTAKLISQLHPLGARYVVRIPLGRLRLGFSDKTIIDALSYMEKGDKSASSQIEAIYQVLPDVGKLAKAVKKDGVTKANKNRTISFGVPVMPMLAQRLKSPEEMIKKMGKVAIEPKFDGLRVLIHFKKGQAVKAFTRNLNEISAMFPEFDLLGQFLNVKEAILDSEAVGLDPQTQQMANFQRTMQRRRKHDIQKLSGDIPLTFQIFDLISKDGQSYMDEPYIKRREVLSRLVKKNKIFLVDEYTLTNDSEVIRQKHKEMLKKGLEGVIVKKADSKYVPGRTGWRWVKMKEEEKAHGKLADTLDCIIMGYTTGKGKRASFGIGQFLAGIKDKDKIRTITKVGTGLSDEQFKDLALRLKKIRSKEKPKDYEVHKDLEPDYWVLPKVVVELAADELTQSPKHTAGLALRFPRLIRFRGDKSPFEATTLSEVRLLHKPPKDR